MRKIFLVTFVAISVLLPITLSAQQNNPGRAFDREAFIAKRNAFITSEMGLTPEEAALFIPLCNELRQKKFEVGNDCRKLSRELDKRKNITDAEYLKTIDECLEVGVKEAELEKEYYAQFKKILPPAKLYKYRVAEFKFARYFMRNEDDRSRDGWKNEKQRDEKK